MLKVYVVEMWEGDTWNVFKVTTNYEEVIEYEDSKDFHISTWEV